MSNRLRARRAPAAIALLLGGCAAQMQPVADFGASANHLAAAYRPFASDLQDSCEQQHRYVALSARGDYDDEAVRRDAAGFCASYRQAAAVAVALDDALSAYAVALVTLSRAKPTAFDADIRHVSTRLATLTRDGSPVIPDEALSVATKALRATALLVEEGKVQTLARATLRDNQAALQVVVDAMKRYADAVYDRQLAETRAVLESEHASLVAASRAAAASDVPGVLPWRLAQPAMRADIDANKLAHDRVRAFDRAADALVASHADLIANFDTSRGAQWLQTVQDFIAKVKALETGAARL